MNVHMETVEPIPITLHPPLCTTPASFEAFGALPSSVSKERPEYSTWFCLPHGRFMKPNGTKSVDAPDKVVPKVSRQNILIKMTCVPLFIQ